MSQIIREKEKLIIKPGQNLVASIANSFRSELHSLLQESPKELIIDLGGVDIVDSVGIGIIIAAHNSINKLGGKLKIVNIAKNTYDLFVTMRLNRHFILEPVK
ncbi:MAG: STAS domain-containing protein [Desulfobacterales bacterium]|nr:STAS domain-containing protein [Desulfobacterales bacterium]MBF0398060.1 STAS domain-containing protein [Desulfobacterales bacterium]